MKVMRALIPGTVGVPSAECTASASFCGRGTGPPLEAATAIAVPPATAMTIPARVARSRWVEVVLRNLITTAFLVSVHKIGTGA